MCCVPKRGERLKKSYIHKTGSRYFLGVFLQISDEHPFCMGVPPGDSPVLTTTTGKVSAEASWRYAVPKKGKERHLASSFTGLNFAFVCFGCSFRSAINEFITERNNTKSTYLLDVQGCYSCCYRESSPLLELFAARHWETGLKILEYSRKQVVITSVRYLQLYNQSSLARKKQDFRGFICHGRYKKNKLCKTRLTHQTSGSGLFFRLPVVLRENENVLALYCNLLYF